MLCSWVCRAEVNLRMVTWDGDESLRVIRTILTDFEKAHPGVHVQLETVDYNNYVRKLLIQYSAKMAPDVCLNGDAQMMMFASKGALLPLNNFLDQDKTVNVQDYYPSSIETYTRDNKLYILTRDVAPFGLLYYNKKAFADAGIPLPDGSWTWDTKIRPELKEKDFGWVLQQLQKKDASGKIIRYSLTPWWVGGFLDCLTYSRGLRYVDDPAQPTKLLWDDPLIHETYNFGAELITKDHFIPSPTDLSNMLGASAVQLFMQGKTAMYLCGIWDVPKLRDVLVPGKPGFFDWDIAPFPKYAGAKLGPFPQVLPSGGSGYSIISTTAHPQESWELVKWLSSKPGMTKMAAAGIAQPAVMKLAQQSPWLPGPTSKPIDRFPEHIGITDDVEKYSILGNTWKNWTEVNNFMNSQFERVWGGTATMDEALTQGYKDASQRMAQMKKIEDLPPFDWTKAIIAGVLLITAVITWIYWPERNVKYSTRERAENRSGYKFIAPFLLGLIFFTVGPMLVSLITSFSEWDGMTPARYRGLGNYAEAFTEDSRYWTSLKATAIFTFASVPLGIIVSLALALLLNQKVRGIPIYRTCFYLPALGSTVASSLIWKKMFMQEGGLFNRLIYGADGHGNFLGIAHLLAPLSQPGQQINWLGSEKTALLSIILMTAWGVGGGMMILLAGLQGINHSYYEAAELDGASGIQKFKAVTLPLLTPSLFFVLITGVIGSFQVFTQAFVMTAGGPNNATRFMVLHIYESAFVSIRMGYASALGWLLFAIILVFSLLQFRLQKFVFYEADTK